MNNVNTNMTTSSVMTSSKRENEEIMNKLDRILGFCSNTKENIDSMILKFSMNDPEIYNENHLKEDMKVVSTNIDSIMNFVDPIFKHYLVLPNTTENENLPIFLNTRKSDNLIKYENSLMDKKLGSERNIIDGYYSTSGNNLENTNSPQNLQNLNEFSINKESDSYNSKIKENMNNISRVLSERIKKNVKDNLGRASYNYKPEKERNTSELVTLFEVTKKILNKK
jgi:hypothetical protein